MYLQDIEGLLILNKLNALVFFIHLRTERISLDILNVTFTVVFSQRNNHCLDFSFALRHMLQGSE